MEGLRESTFAYTISFLAMEHQVSKRKGSKSLSCANFTRNDLMFFPFFYIQQPYGFLINPTIPCDNSVSKQVNIHTINQREKKIKIWSHVPLRPLFLSRA